MCYMVPVRAATGDPDSILKAWDQQIPQAMYMSIDYCFNEKLPTVGAIDPDSGTKNRV